MSRKKTFIKGTFILTIAGLISRVIGFAYRIFLSQTFGAEEMGIYQLIFPIYVLGLALSTSGIESAISKCVSAKVAIKQKEEAKSFLMYSMFISFAISLLCTYATQKYASYISTFLLKENRTYELLIILSYVFPFTSIHSCILGYYFGLKETHVPAISQLIEQLSRVLSVLLIYRFILMHGGTPNITLAVIGLVIGEIISTVFIIFYTTRKNNMLFSRSLSISSFLVNCRELFPLSIPLTANRVTINLLNSIEAVSIPLALQTFGLSASAALSTYGVLFGMALPCILFPTAITSSISAMLLPTVSEIQALNNKKEIKLVVHKTIQYCTLLGLFCLISFFIFSDIVGYTLFNNAEVSQFLKVLAWLCPFLYLNTTLLSIINGLGQPVTTFFLNVTSLLIRIASIFILIPKIGILGYLSGLLISQMFLTLGCILTFRKSCII